MVQTKFLLNWKAQKFLQKTYVKNIIFQLLNFGIFNNQENSLSFLENCKYPIVVKADGLAAGKGVYICETKQQSHLAVKEIFNQYILS